MMHFYLNALENVTHKVSKEYLVILYVQQILLFHVMNMEEHFIFQK